MPLKYFSQGYFKAKYFWRGVVDVVVEAVRGAQVYVRTTLLKAYTWLVETEARVSQGVEDTVAGDKTVQQSVRPTEQEVSSRSLLNRIRVLVAPKRN